MTRAGRRPNLFLVGSMKCGTTSLHTMLDAHPDIFMSRGLKEPAWFAGTNSAKSLDWYLDHFAEATNERYIGESSTDYTKAPRLGPVANRIKEFAPDARILFIMRDPVARAISHYWWEVEYSAEGRSFPEAMKASREIADVGNYAMQLRPYVETFGRERVHALTMEALTADPRRAMVAIFDFLGLAAVAGEALELVHDNRGKETVARVSGPFSRLKGTPIWAAAKAVMPKALRKQALSALARPAPRVIPDDEFEAGLDIIRPRMMKETEALSRLLGRDFPEWRQLYAGVAPAGAGQD
jgi:hypothetical protein